ncbi:putative ABC transporter, permease protein [Magnetospirillum sp. LM-5]|uniref:ABC transporter permease n=1 Tax=Magnetospirillum sp. LM-5 TaxID=2681466 RepID=UPI0013821A2D|nr:FtsX-like permease family protein [Magnetospirillum sp. LM-5]CAA7617483.1 putative ABC transporter, permease protein [Magnetospirillum sp. LM-5]
MSLAALRFARRELRGGLAGFRILMACLALGVAAISGAGSLKAAFHAALTQDARALLGGDLDIRQSYQPVTDPQLAALKQWGTVSQGADLRVMARFGDARRLVELKAVDRLYPLVGRVVLEPAQDLSTALAVQDGLPGAVAEAGLLDALGISLGDTIRIGDASVQVRALLVAEPDRVANALSFGPRLVVGLELLPATGLLQPGALVRWSARLVLDQASPAQAKAELAERFPDAPWQVRDTTEAAPGLGRILDNIAAFLTLVGLTSLLVGGIGVASSVKAVMDGRLRSIAALKAAGAGSGMIFATYALLVGGLALAGILAGLVAGGLLPGLVVALAGDALPIAAKVGIYPLPLMVAFAFGLLTALVFGLAPLARAARTPATRLFRGPGEEPTALGWPVLAIIGTAALAMAALAVVSADRKGLAAVFVAAAPATLLLFRALAWALAGLSARLARRRTGLLAHPAARLALANLYRPGSTIVGMVISLGLGLTVLVTTALVEGNLARQFGEKLPAEAPSFFFIDLQPDQAAGFDFIVRSADPQARIERAPMVRGRVVALNGVPAPSVTVAPEAEWALRGDRGLTSAAQMPPGTRLAAGAWWTADHAGPPLVSLDAPLAKGLGLGLGDQVTLNVLGREITARVASLREVEWSSLNMNFAFVLSPDALAGAPHTWLATVHADAAHESAVERAVTDRFANVSAIRVKEALGSVRDLVARADQAVRLAALVTLAGGALVLAGAVMAGHRRRVREAVVLKVLGATRADLWRAWLVEFGAVGGVTGLLAGAIGTLAAWAILVFVMKADWAFLPVILAATLAVCVSASLAAGFAGTWAAISAKAAPELRAE